MLRRSRGLRPLSAHGGTAGRDRSASPGAAAAAILEAGRALWAAAGPPAWQRGGREGAPGSAAPRGALRVRAGPSGARGGELGNVEREWRQFVGALPLTARAGRPAGRPGLALPGPRINGLFGHVLIIKKTG